MLREDNIDIYNNSSIILNKKTPSLIKSWIIILTLLSILFITIIFIPYNRYIIYNGYVILKDSNSYISLNINKNDFPIKNKNKLYIENDEYKYKIISIEKNNLILSINLKDNIKINNNLVTLHILKDRTTLFEKIKTRIKKGFGL